jgi:hypothetical protein
MATKMSIEEAEAPTYHGLPVLDLHVGDMILTPRAPTRYAVHVGPDLARYLLTFNYEDNRNKRPRKIRAMVADMVAGRWLLTPQAPMFSSSGVLINGQNTLNAIIESGCMIWTVVEFGWPDEVGQVIDRGTARTGGDTLHYAGIPNSTLIASIVSRVYQHAISVGKSNQFSGLDVPPSTEILQIVNSNPDRFQAAARYGNRLYKALEKGGSPSIWGTAYYLIARRHGPKADVFFDAVAEESGDPRSATRALARWFHKRPASATRTGDDREAIEVIIRAFNGWLDGKSYSFPKYRGFLLSRVK